MTIEYSLLFRQKMRRIHGYILGKLHNKRAAQGFVDKILHGCSLLKDQPYLGMALEGLTGKQSAHKYIIFGNYMAIYMVLDTKVLLLDLFDCRTDYVNYLLKY